MGMIFCPKCKNEEEGTEMHICQFCGNMMYPVEKKSPPDKAKGDK